MCSFFLAEWVIFFPVLFIKHQVFICILIEKEDKCWRWNLNVNCDYLLFERVLLTWAYLLIMRLSFYFSTLSFQKNFLYFYLFLCEGTFAFMYVCVPLVCLVPVEVRRGHQTFWNWSYRQLWVAMFALGTKLGFSVRAASAFNCWAISPTPLHIFSCWKIRHNWLILIWKNSVMLDKLMFVSTYPITNHLQM